LKNSQSNWIGGDNKGTKCLFRGIHTNKHCLMRNFSADNEVNSIFWHRN
jgi:hypothetical protein